MMVNVYVYLCLKLKFDSGLFLFIFGCFVCIWVCVFGGDLFGMVWRVVREFGVWFELFLYIEGRFVIFGWFGFFF